MIFDEDTIEKLIQKPKPHYLFPVWEHLQGKPVLVTGAGGFIGSHLCKEIAKHKPSVLIMVEANEFALYEAHRKLDGIPVVPVLGSYGDYGMMKDVLDSYKVEYVFHVGAYKHVPLVERNVLSAVDNNVLCADELFIACEETHVPHLIVVSTDKAVRPTNVMGATKRVVEQLALSTKVPDVKVVRFGNVLWSTGSVLPLFYEQLRQGRPVTLTHEDVDRYFMSVQEAVCLILQSIALTDRGIYVFDMGEPVKIKALIQQLAREMKIDAQYLIKVVGLRPGEKLHEELTLGEALESTSHPQILCAREDRMPPHRLYPFMADLSKAVEERDVGRVRSLFQDHVPGYDPMCGIVDDLFLHKFVTLKGRELEDCFEVPTIDSAG